MPNVQPNTLAPLTFSLDTKLPGISGSAAIEVAVSSDADVVMALADPGAGRPFPDREVELGRVQLKAAGDITFSPGAAKVSFAAKAEAAGALAVYHTGAKVLQSLAFEDAAQIGLAFPIGSGERLMVIEARYSASGKVGGTHPIGAIGAGSFGLEGKRSAQYAIVRRFDAAAPAADVVASTVKSWKLPRHVTVASDLPPGTWLIAEVDGSFAAQLSAQVGQDFSYLREIRTGALTGDIGLKIAARIRATIGVSASGRYLVVVDRESLDDPATALRCRMFKLSKKGWNFGLDLHATVQGVADPLPENARDLVKAVLGLHNAQLLKDLTALKDWVDPDKDTSDLVAGLVVGRAVDLVEKVTGLGGKTAAARNKLLAALAEWDALPSRVSAVMSTFFEEKSGLSASQRKTLLATLDILADPAKTRGELEKLIGDVRFAEIPVGKLLVAVAERGLLSLFDRVPEVVAIAARARAILTGEVIERLHRYLSEKLNIDRLKEVVSFADFEKLEPFLVDRLSAILDRKLGFEQIDELKQAIGRAEAVIEQSYSRMRDAVTRKYDFEFAYAYQRATARTALVDVTFDTSEAEAQALLVALLGDGNLDTLFVAPARGVTLRTGVLTHEITRQADVRIDFPFYKTQTQTLGSSLAKVTASSEGDGVLFYELDATDAVNRKNRFKSQLSLTAAFTAGASAGGVRIHSAPTGTLSYAYRHAQKDARFGDLKPLLGPFVDRYLPRHFTGGAATPFDTWLIDLDRRVEEVVGNGTNEFGDVLLSLEVRAPGSCLAAWLQPRSGTQLEAAKRAVSMQLQESVKSLLYFSHVRDAARLHQDPPMAGLLAYASIPPCTSAIPEAGRIRFVGDRGTYWYSPIERKLTRAVTRAAETQGRMLALMRQARERLEQAGLPGRAKDFADGELHHFLAFALPEGNITTLEALLNAEMQVVNGALDALEKLSDAQELASMTPSTAIERLAEFGDAITQSFHHKFGSVYGRHTVRALGTLAFVQASLALGAGSSDLAPAGLMSITVLREDATFAMERFLDGELPLPQQVAVAERLVSGPVGE